MVPPLLWLRLRARNYRIVRVNAPLSAARRPKLSQRYVHLCDKADRHSKKGRCRAVAHNVTSALHLALHRPRRRNAVAVRFGCPLPTPIANLRSRVRSYPELLRLVNFGNSSACDSSSVAMRRRSAAMCPAGRQRTKPKATRIDHHSYLIWAPFSRISALLSPSSRARRYQNTASARSPGTRSCVRSRKAGS
jgi:hypothetical protein